MKISPTSLLTASTVGFSILSCPSTAFVLHPKTTVTPISLSPTKLPMIPNSRKAKSALRHESTTSYIPIAPPQVSSNQALSIPLPRKKKILSRLEGMLSVDSAVCTAYLFNILVLSLPIVLVPLAVTEYAGPLHTSNFIASKVAMITSIASIGGALGKFINGFVCQELGTYSCSKWYLVGLAACTLLFSLSTSTLALGVSIAGMEFFASVQCASLAVMLSDYYKGNMAKLTAALTAMGLSSTIGEMMAKVLGTSLSSALSWRHIAQIATLLALSASAVISVAPGQKEEKEQRALTKKPFHLSSISNSLKGVLGSGLFWKLALAYSMVFVAGISDRIMGSFYHSATNLSLGVCGGLTLSITLGLVHGMVTASRKIAKLQGATALRKFLKRRYVVSIAATFGLAVLATLGPALISNPIVMGTLLFFLSFVMASNISYQCYQLPALIAKDFADQQAVVISFMDGFGYLLSVPLFASLGKIVPKYGWSPGFSLLTVLFAAGGVLMMKSIHPILKLIANEEEQ